MTCPAAFNQKAFRGRNDDGNETTATWKANQNTNWSQVVDTNFRVRFEIQETAACAGANKVWRLQYNRTPLGGSPAGWVDASASSNVVRASASPNLADAANLTDQLTVGTGTFVGATGFDEVDCNAGGSSMDVAASGHSECEFCVQLRSADTAAGDTIQLRVTDAGSALAAYDATPTMTRSSGAVSLTPTTAGLTLTGYAPTVAAPRQVTPTTASLVLTTYAPTVAAGAGTVVTPTTASLVLTGFAPTVAAPRQVTPDVAALVLTGFAPTVAAPRDVMPTTASLVLTGYAPTVEASSGAAPAVPSIGGGSVMIGIPWQSRRREIDDRVDLTLEAAYENDVCCLLTLMEAA